MRVQRAVVLICCVMTAANASIAAEETRANGQTTMTRQERPNFVLFLNDDQDLILGGFSKENMPRTFSTVVENGAVASRWFIHTPVCCPSRGEILSGRYLYVFCLSRRLVRRT